MKMYLKYYFLINLLFILCSFTNTVSSEPVQCSSEYDYMCFYESALNISKELQFIDDDNLFEDKVKQATIDYEKFLSLVDLNGFEVSNEVLIFTYNELSLLNKTKVQSSDFEAFEEVIDYIQKSIDLGAVWNTWQYCDYAYEFYEWNKSENLNEEKKQVLDNYLNEALDNCLFFIKEGQYTEISDAEFLQDYWGKASREAFVFKSFYNLLWIYYDQLNSAESLKYALIAEEKANSKKEEWLGVDVNLFPILYNFLGWSYSNGYGTPKDHIKSIKYLEKASELNDYNASSNLGDRYRLGDFVEQDFLKAKFYYEQTLEINDEDPWTLFHLGQMYAHGWGVEKDETKSAEFFERILNLYLIAIKNPEEYYDWELERIEDTYDTAERYLQYWDGHKYTATTSYVCNQASEKYYKNYNLSHLVSVCSELAEAGDIAAAYWMIEFYALGNEVTQDYQHAYNLLNELIETIEIDKNKYVKSLENKSYNEKEVQDTLDMYLDFLKMIAFDFISKGNVSGVEPEKAYSFISDVLIGESGKIQFLKFNDSTYTPDFINLALLKVEGWGTDQDLYGAEEIIKKIRHKIDFFQNNPDQINIQYETEDDFKENSFFLSEVEDRLSQVKSGFDTKSNIFLAFPAIYTGTFQFYDGFSQAAWLSLDMPKQIGIDKYLLTGKIKISSNIYEDEEYLVSGVLDEKTRLISFDEFDIGDFATTSAEYVPGQYHGNFNEDYDSFNANFVSKKTSDHAYLEVYKTKSERADQKKDYKEILGIGKQYAILIGNNEYKNLKPLNTATADARSLGDLLKNKYGFEVEEPLINATRSEILTKLADMGNILSENDSLLIFYAGHGRQEEITGRGYWSPIDANKQDYINDISNDDITNLLQKIDAKHILVIADTCYSGTLVLRGDNRIENINLKYLKDLGSKYSRKALTSGALQPVSDSGSNGHSAFASSLLRALANNSEVLTANALHEYIRPDIMSNYKQTPLYNIVASTKDEGGEFLFIPIQ